MAVAVELDAGTHIVPVQYRASEGGDMVGTGHVGQERRAEQRGLKSGRIKGWLRALTVLIYLYIVRSSLCPCSHASCQPHSAPYIP